MSRKKIVRHYVEKNIIQEPRNSLQTCGFKDAYYCPLLGQERCIPGKASLNQRISAFFMEKVQALSIPTYFVKTLNMMECAVKPVKPLPFFIKVWNYPNELLAKRFPRESSLSFPRPLLEYWYDPKNGCAPGLISREHIEALNWIEDLDSLEQIENQAVHLNDVLQGICVCFGLRVDSFSLELGYGPEGKEGCLVCSEITPDYVDWWDLKGDISFDKVQWSRGSEKEIARELQSLAKRLGLMGGGANPRFFPFQNHPASQSLNDN